MDKAQPIWLNHHEDDGGRAKNGTQPKQYGPQCTFQFGYESQIVVELY